MIQVNACNLCNSNNVKHLYHITNSKPEFNVSKCQNCGLIFQNPRFSDTQISDFYKEEYYTGKTDYTYVDERVNFKHSAYVWDKRIKTLLKYLKTDKNQAMRFLDIGCSFGGFLKRAQNSGFKTYGIDISDYSTAYARDELGLKNVVCGEFSAGMYEENFFDIVTMVEVIEHVKNPKKIIDGIYKVLKPGGIALIQTANMDGRQAKKAGKDYHYFLPGHLFYFSKKTLCKYLKDSGFSGYKVFHGVDFGLIPKLKKSAGSFNKWHEYFKWLKISFYHAKSAIHFKNFALTSSMVVYGFK